ncbi:hypothetical protein NESM_000333700 [Novymonas esmeraldas]|uniref:Transmembrane protein n=1 Tax=Novymonas esmeraldas TaxID=1808958 RepID=A0AAW0EL93_9TRYP
MLRCSRAARFIVPSSSSPELPRFLSRRSKPIVTTSGDLREFVMEYDHRSTMSYLFRGPSNTDFFSSSLFSGSLTAGILTAGGIALFVLTFAYNVGKPVATAHRELFWRHPSTSTGSATNAAEAVEDDNDDGEVHPVEEFDDLVEMEREDE